MQHSILNIKIPESLEYNEFDVKMVLASRLYELGKLTSGQAAEMVGITKRTFLELLSKYNVSIIGYTMEEEDLSVI